MKKITVTFVLLVIQTISYSQSSWVDQILPAAPPEINSVSAVNKDICWIGGSSGTVYYTSNGGSGWLNRSSGLFSGGNVTCIIGKSDGITAFCLVNTSGYGKIFKTSDAGISWVQIYARLGGTLQAMKFYNSTSAYVYGNPAFSKWLVLKTTNNGTSFDSLSTTPNGYAGENGYPNVLETIDIGGGFQKIWFGTNLAGVYYSTNSGISWLFSPTSGNQHVYTIKFLDANNGFCGGDSPYKTTNGGVTWNFQANYPNTGSYKSFAGIWGFLWFCSGSKIYYSSNSGTSFAYQHISSNSASYTHMSFNVTINDDILSTLTGWAVTNSIIVSKFNEENIGIKLISTEIPESFQLYQNYPNPFNPGTKIRFSVHANRKGPFVNVKLVVYDITGREVVILVNEQLKPGTYETEWDGSSFTSGIYYYQLSSESFTDVKKMVLLK